MIAHAFVGFSHVLILLDRLDDATIFIENLLDVRGTWWRWSGSAREESDALDFNLFAVFKLEINIRDKFTFVVVVALAAVVVGRDSEMADKLWTF